MRASVVVSALVAALVGFGGTLAIVVAAAQAVGADAAQTSSWVTALCLSMAATSGLLSVRHQLPIITAWSTPGAALIAATGGAIGLEAAVGAFLLAGALVVATASFRPVGGLIQRLPAAVAAGMLAGVLLRFVVAPFESAQTEPLLVLPLIALFLVARLASPTGAVLIVLAAGVFLAAGLGLIRNVPDIGLSTLQPVAPAFEPAVLVGLGVPLFLVTMASQNLPGFAVLRAAGYREVPTRSILTVTGLASLATAPFGAHATNLAAITAAICAGPEAHPDPARHWLAGPVYAACYVVLAAFGASLVELFAAMPPALVTTVAGVALIGPLAGALHAALAAERQRFAAVLALVVTVSGVSVLGIGSPFWGLLAGHVVVAGFGPIGRRVARNLRRQGKDVVIVEFDDARAQAASTQSYLAVLLTAGRDEALSRARLNTAEAFVVIIGDADRRLALTMVARGINPKLRIVVTDDSDAEESWLPHAGASEVVLVDDLVARAVLAQLGPPNAP